eukprot:TRINITY_DN6301_c0_g1_i1.p1 TRINITY_DN6301_c0_g1~~TRINITY_DN6301_c0_g1_i1.p1  ORF type:complete len:216 (+),score=30.10 TRINITY_DN6301_c0_g1_i1:61-648(+)
MSSKQRNNDRPSDSKSRPGVHTGNDHNLGGNLPHEGPEGRHSSFHPKELPQPTKIPQEKDISAKLSKRKLRELDSLRRFSRTLESCHKILFTDLLPSFLSHCSYIYLSSPLSPFQSPPSSSTSDTISLSLNPISISEDSLKTQFCFLTTQALFIAFLHLAETFYPQAIRFYVNLLSSILDNLIPVQMICLRDTII